MTDEQQSPQAKRNATLRAAAYLRLRPLSGRLHSRFSWPQLYGSFLLDFVNYSEQQWWRQSPALDLAPAPAIKKQLEDTFAAVKKLAADVPSAGVSGISCVVKMVRLIEIGSSVLGLQLVVCASGNASTNKMAMYFPRSTDAPPNRQYIVASLSWPDSYQGLCSTIPEARLRHPYYFIGNGKVEKTWSFCAINTAFSWFAGVVQQMICFSMSPLLSF